METLNDRILKTTSHRVYDHSHRVSDALALVQNQQNFWLQRIRRLCISVYTRSCARFDLCVCVYAPLPCSELYVCKSQTGRSLAAAWLKPKTQTHHIRRRFHIII